MYCTQCGQQAADGARFCSNCGAALTPPAATPSPYAPPPTPPSPYAPSSPYAPPAASDAPASSEPPAYEAISAEPATTPAPDPGDAAGAPRPAWQVAPMGGSAPGASPPATSPGYGQQPAGADVHPAAGMYAGMASAPFARPRYAGFWRRFWGLALDKIILRIVTLPLGLMLGIKTMFPILAGMEQGGPTPEQMMDLMFGSISMALVSAFVEWVYFAAFQGSSRQATPGQMALGIRVTGLDGRRIGFGRASARYFASWLSGVTLLIGFIMAAFTERKQALHDMIASTLVVRDNPSVI